MKYIVFLLILFISFPFYAEDNSDNIVTLAQETLKLNESSMDYANKKEVTEKYTDVKEFIQQDYKNGNKNARVDVFLLLDGLVQNNLSSLQSLLSTNNNDIFAKEFSENINYNYAEKLAYALKENKLLLSTEYDIETNSKNNHCTNYVNGTLIKNNNSFLAPAGLPYYIGSYCDNNTFSVIKIQSEPAQAKYIIKLNDYQPIQFSNKNLRNESSNISSSIPQNKESSSTIINNQSNFTNSTSQKMTYNTEDIQFSSRFGYNYFSGETQDKKISNGSLTYGSMIYTKLMGKFKRYLFALSYAPINKDVVTFQNTTLNINDQNIISQTKNVHIENGTFLRPQIGIEAYSFNINDNLKFNLETSLLYTIMSFSSTTSHSLGVNIMPTFEYNLSPKFTLQISLETGLNFPAGSSEFYFGPELGLGYQF